MLKEINIENLEEKLILTSVNQTWFKFLAIITILCSIIVYAALIWLLVCRTNRLRHSDEQIKQNHLIDLKLKSKHRSKLKRQIRYLFFGKTESDSSSARSASSSITTLPSPPSKTKSNSNNLKPILVNNKNEISNQTKTANNNKSKYKRKDSKFKDLYANIK